MAKSTKAITPKPAEEKTAVAQAAEAMQDIRLPSRRGSPKRPAADPGPELELGEAPSKAEPVPNRRAARTPLDQLDPTLVYLGNVVRKARKARDLTQLEFAKQCGFNQSAIFMVEAGRQNMTIRSLMSIAKLLDLQVGDLFPRSTPRTAAKLTELRDVISDTKDRIQAQLRHLDQVSQELDEEAGNLD